MALDKTPLYVYILKLSFPLVYMYVLDLITSLDLHLSYEDTQVGIKTESIC